MHSYTCVKCGHAGGVYLVSDNNDYEQSMQFMRHYRIAGLVRGVTFEVARTQ